MFRRRDRGGEPPPVMVMPRPPWLDDDTDIPDDPTCPDTAYHQHDHPLATGTEGGGGPDGAESGHAPGPTVGEVADGGGPIDNGQAGQVAVCWAIDHLSTDPEVPARRAELAVPGQIVLDPDDPAVRWVDLRVLVTTDPSGPATGGDPSAAGPPPDETSEEAASATGAGFAAFGGSRGRARGWDSLPASRRDRQWWRGSVAVRRCGCGCGEITVDHELISKYMTVDVRPAHDACGADNTRDTTSKTASKTTDGGDSNVD